MGDTADVEGSTKAAVASSGIGGSTDRAAERADLRARASSIYPSSFFVASGLSGVSIEE